MTLIFNHVRKSCNSCNCIAWAQELSICSSSTVHWDLNHSEQSVPQDLQHAVSPTAHFRYLVLSHSVGNKHYHYTMYIVLYIYTYLCKIVPITEIALAINDGWVVSIPPVKAPTFWVVQSWEVVLSKLPPKVWSERIVNKKHMFYSPEV